MHFMINNRNTSLMILAFIGLMGLFSCSPALVDSTGKKFTGDQNSPEGMLHTILTNLRSDSRDFENITYGLGSGTPPAVPFLMAEPNKRSTLLRAILDGFQSVQNSSGSPHFIDILQLGNNNDSDAFQEQMADAIVSIANQTSRPVIIRYLEGNSIYEDQAPDKHYGFFDMLKSRFTNSNSEVYIYAANLDYNWQDVPGSPGSWNHSKIFSIDGTFSIVGGQNFWSDYLGNQNNRLYDLSYQVDGTVANFTHTFADFLWKYIADPSWESSTTHKSWKMGTANSVGTDIPAAYGTGSRYPQGSAGDIPILGVGNLGLWYDESVRVLAEFSDAATVTVTKSNPPINKAINTLIDYPFDETLDSDASKAYQASTTARHMALKMVQQNGHIRIAQQKIADTDITGKFHKELKKNYVIWPGEFLEAIVDVLLSKNAKVDFLLSNHIVSPNLSGGYSDDMGGAALREVLIERVASKNGGNKTAATQKVNSLVTIKQTPANYYNHSKVWIVDDNLFYIGSQNIYPGYLQQYGYITGHQATCQQFIDTYWNYIWGKGVIVN